MISRDDVFSGYRMILGREPENEGTINYHCRHESLSAFRRALLASDEFNQLYPRAQNGLDIPFPDWADLTAPRVVFMHSPKTGGTTFHELLIGHFEENLVCPERFNGIRKHAAGELAKYRLFSGHYDLVSCHLIPGEKRIVTFLREPVSRLISLYNFLRAHRPDVVERNDWGLARLAADLDAEQFFQHPVARNHPYIENGMTRALVDSLPIEEWAAIDESIRPTDIADAGELALERLSSLTAFGVLERYRESVDLIFDSLGLASPQEIGRKMVLSDIVEEESNYRPVEVAQESPRLRAVIEELVRMDLELYRGASSIFEDRYRAFVSRQSTR